MCSYAGMLLAGIVFLPFAWAAPMGGHSLLYLIIFVCPLGLFGGLIAADLKRHVRTTSIIIRTLFAVVISIMLILVLGSLEMHIGSRGYLLVPIILPFLAAALSDLIEKQKDPGADRKT